jgi:hypothetical protein
MFSGQSLRKELHLMNASRLLVVARRMEKLQQEIATLQAEARQLITGETAEVKPRKKKMSAAARKRISAAMKRKWAARKKKG